jgi:exosome complex exonuclease RRP6
MQITTATGGDFVVDLLVPQIRQAMRDEMGVVLSDPSIVKVFHGAESDVVWLQQDFDLFVVGMFDTYHATKALEFPSHSLASLLSMYCDFSPDKRYQMADWRIR